MKVTKIKTELLWNSLIFQLYKNRISINSDEIEEQLKLLNTKEIVGVLSLLLILFLPINLISFLEFRYSKRGLVIFIS